MKRTFLAVLALFFVVVSGNVAATAAARYSYMGPTKNAVVDLSSTDKMALEKAIEQCFGKEQPKVKTAIAAVVLNQHVVGFGTIEEIISNDFPTKRARERVVVTSTTTKRAVKNALFGFDPSRRMFKNGSRHFSVEKDERKLNLKIGRFYFYENRPEITEKITTTKKAEVAEKTPFTSKTAEATKQTITKKAEKPVTQKVEAAMKKTTSEAIVAEAEKINKFAVREAATTMKQVSELSTKDILDRFKADLNAPRISIQIKLKAPKKTEYVYNVTPEERELLEKVCYGEAGGEPHIGKVAVIAVVLNRHRTWGMSIRDVIFQRGAFSSTPKFKRITKAQMQTCSAAVEEALQGVDPTRKVFPNGAKYFFAYSWISKKEARKREGVTKLRIGGHDFHDSFAPRVSRNTRKSTPKQRNNIKNVRIAKRSGNRRGRRA